MEFVQFGPSGQPARSRRSGSLHRTLTGGIRVDADTAQSPIPGLFAAGEVAAGLHGAAPLEGNSLSDLLVFGRRAGLGAAVYAAKLDAAPSVDDTQVAAAAEEMLAPFDASSECPREERERPYEIEDELQSTMQRGVGASNGGDDLAESLEKIQALQRRAVLEKFHLDDDRRYNPGWHLAMELRNLLIVAEAIVRSAHQRTESRGVHSRVDYPEEDPQLGGVNSVVRYINGAMSVTQEPAHARLHERADLAELLEHSDAAEVAELLDESDAAEYADA